MTFVRLMEFLHETGLDVFLLGLLNGFISALVEKLPERYGKKLPAKLLAGLPFLLGILLYSLWFVAAVRDFSSPPFFLPPRRAERARKRGKQTFAPPFSASFCPGISKNRN